MTQVEAQSEVSSRLTIERTLEPTIELCRTAQLIGYQAWNSAIADTRTVGEIGHVFKFDGDINEGARALLGELSEMKGKFVGVVARIGDNAVGYFMAQDHKPRNRFVRLVNTVVGNTPEARIIQENVIPEYQGKGIGSVMAYRGLEPFDEAQVSTALVLGENQDALEWFQNRSYHLAKSSVFGRVLTPATKHGYFGEGTNPASEWTLVSDSVSLARNKIRNRHHWDLPIHDLVES